jgi:hypothetical protein
MISATLAMSVGIILWFLSCAATFPFVVNGGSVAPSMKLFSALLPNTAIIWGYRLIVTHESKSKWIVYVFDMH